MPAKNAIKQYVENGYYHIYNRGVEKRVIFQDEQDYGVFLSYLKEYLSEKNEKELNKRLADPNISWPEKNKILKILRMNNFAGEITLLAYCLMPNHFHFFVKQNKAESINLFMRSLGTRYTAYFNKKYKRVGSLCQGVYKAVLVTSDPQFLHLTRYIHRQAILQGESLKKKQQPCSFPEYMGYRKTEWVIPTKILAYFDNTNPKLSYKNFVMQNDGAELLPEFTLEED